MKIRKSLAPMACVLCLSLVAGALVLRLPSVASVIGATVDIYPVTLNLNSNGTWITAYIELPDGDVNDINVPTVLLGTVPVTWSNVIGNKLLVKFDRQAVIDYIWAELYHMEIDPSTFPKGGIDVTLTITGEVAGTLEVVWDAGARIPFAGSDTITVIYEG